jgi:hypothetical protein
MILFFKRVKESGTKIRLITLSFSRLTKTGMPEKSIDYFAPDYRASRKRVVKEYRDLVETALPIPEKNWGVIWPLVGPELTFEEQAPTVSEEAKKIVAYNQTKRRFETAIHIARQVTALRVGKGLDEVTVDDIEKAGPIVYWNGRKEHNDNLTRMMASGELEKNYHFPISKITITTNQEITNTKEQFDDFPNTILPQGDKVIIVTDLYHLPRTRRYLDQHPDKFSQTRSILFPSQPVRLPPKMALREIKAIFPYSQKGDLPPEKK